MSKDFQNKWDANINGKRKKPLKIEWISKNEGNFNDSFIESIRWKENKWKIDEQFSNSAVSIEAVSISSYAAEFRTR